MCIRDRWYNMRVDACELKEDIENLRGGDSYNVGPNGNKLSGGQKQRVAICRAVYQDCDIYLFDDIFSSLDYHVSERIFKKLIQELLKDAHKTIILAISQYEFLKHSDNIIYMDGGQLLEDHEDLDKYMIQQLEKRQSSIKEEEMKANLDKVLQDDKNVIQKKAEKEKEAVNEEEELREQGGVKLHTFKIYANAAGGFLITMYFTSAAASQASRNAIDFWLKNGLGTNPNIELGAFVTSMSILIGIVMALTLCRATFTALTTCYAAKNIFITLTQKIMYSQMKFFDQTPLGRITNRFSKDIFSVDNDVSIYGANFFEMTGILIGVLAGIAIQLPYVLIVFVLSAYLIWTVQKNYRHALRETTRLDANNNSKVLTLLTETSTGIITIRAFKKEGKFLRDFLLCNRDKVNSELMIYALNFWCNLRLGAISTLIFACIALFCFLGLSVGFIPQYSTIGLVLAYVLVLNTSIGNCTLYMVMAEKAFIAVERVRHYLVNTTESLDAVALKDKSIASDVLTTPEDAIVFTNVRMTYDEEITPASTFALDQVSFKIRKGEKIAFCGRTGSGKTSILNALFRFYDIQQGKIHVLGQDTSCMSLTALRKSMSVIPQFGFLFQSSVRDNIDPQLTRSDEEIKTIFAHSGLKIRGVNQKLKLEVDDKPSEGEAERSVEEDAHQDADIQFKIEKSGNNLSNGEKQIINFLRILVRDAPIICLDEATSNMDPETDAALQQALFAYTVDKTLLVITHRLENIHLYDRIFVMDRGKIVEEGSYQELSKRENGFFSKMKNED
eukprot:TRINITY_DN7533_c0_g8_i4.p1 TRINITY_DN7533_c0_g8~~TRINITY_DN7533_c0_g8_i4.p1  ORF type:complete len:786 (-),score=149.85 TRINITY_DN7533_c0_g8_i4:123-2480(-)